ncbi:DUF4296 domain-containing protein [Marinilabilia sp.]|uniref:DUF4296 domain-containing protein n=1 Tax=Marinilabilia sp. TaxID=2021252 RepID=UPI0025BB53CF|nr:DUF4296 domain-containing protein [Marinilabilia sp.]
MIRIIIIFPVIVLFLLSGCSPNEPIPKDFPDQEEMAEILTDLYFAESVLSNSRYDGGSENPEDLAPGYYKYVLEDYGLSTTEFDSIRQWYVSHPHHYQEVYDKVVLSITKREAALNKQIKAEGAASDSLPEVRDLWELDREIITVNSTDTADHRLPFVVSADSLSGGQIRFSAFYRFLRPDMSKESRTQIVTLFADSTSDTLSVALNKVFEKKSISLVANIDTAPPVIEISGFLFQHDTTLTGAVEFTEIRLEHLEALEDDKKDLELIKKGVDVR